MHPIRLLSRWTLTLAAIVLTLLALALLVLRLALMQVDSQAPRLESLLAARFNAQVELGHLQAGLYGLDPQLEAGELTIRTAESRGSLPLLEAEHARLRLDTGASLREGIPVVEDARLRGLTLHLYQDERGGWHWPDPAEIPPELRPETEFNFERLDFWVGVLLRQRAWVEDLRLVLHGRERRVELLAPRVLMTGDARHAHLEGEVHLAGQREASLQAVLEVFPGPGGLSDFSAALQADMRLDTLIDLVEVFTRNDPLRLEEAQGEARLWGRWHRGALVDARLDLDVPRLAFRHDDEIVALEGVEARGQWLRSEAGWDAWLQGDAGTVDWAEPSELAEAPGPALPRHWHLRHRGDDWWLNTSEFDLASLAAWRDRVPLPEGLTRVIETLAPRGRVEGLGFGLEQGHWLARAAVYGVEVSPWGQAPGGGPIDAWVEARDLTGRVRFVGAGDATLNFPEVFAAPMALSHASGEVAWSYDGPRTFVSGRGLRAGWQGAEVEGGFGLAVGGGVAGGLGLDLRFRDADALERPLVDWLPVGVLGDALNDWLADGVAGYVPAGSLQLHLPLFAAAEPLAPKLDLNLAIERGRLAFAPGWPALEAVEGQLRVGVGSLEGEVTYAESHGVEARRGRVTLDDDRLRVSGELAADAESLRRYLRALPVDGMRLLDDWRGAGRAEGDLALDMRLGAPEAFQLDIDTEVAFERLEQRSLGLVFQDLSGPLAWRQRGEDGGLEGRLQAQLLGGPVSADVDTRAGGIDLSGTAQVARFLALGGAGALDERLSGRLAWRGRLALGDAGNSLALRSDLSGVAIDLPEPLGKSAGAVRPLRVDVDLDGPQLRAELGRDVLLRWRRHRPGSTVGQGQLWLGRLPAAPSWPQAEGWEVAIEQPRLDPVAWGRALAPLVDEAHLPTAERAALRRLELWVSCLMGPDGCIGSLDARAEAQVGGGWRVALDGSLVAGHLDYRPRLDMPLDIALSRLSLDGFLAQEDDSPGELLDEVAVAAPEPVALPGWVTRLPDGRLRIADIERRGRRFGPFTAYWSAGRDRLSIAPLGLTLGQVSARGDLVWEAAGAGSSLTRARLDLDGRDLGTALERLGQPVTIRSGETRVRSQLAWPGAPWQFALARSRGSVDVALRNGRFVNVESPSARLIGLFNVDNLVRRLRLDFSDVTGQGTAFDSVDGGATLYEGVLETRGPVAIEGPATSFTLEGSVDLVRRELDQRLGVTVPVSRNLALAAVIAGAPVVGGALFIADRLFGGAIDRVTRIHYRVRGPWDAPQITLESAE
ncbi:DUF3971 domain-containing protein [Halomonas campisalis]|uniref:DUF3971 domain-containing protein n=1 Tax=Billgrantia campisalis TaxID=74661 RepID=A0ABS9P5V1_9GAMM|nr:AsmA-like C-terminal region-containing protein [Halomonas campisalis]MCG6656475.1 DUF3971 domain-containing protein [Halomonas campisalis]MDR5861661.1 AsmA-like C-terminal region-containing protein [Halomonas campisalis]